MMVGFQPHDIYKDELLFLLFFFWKGLIFCHTFDIFQLQFHERSDLFL